MATIYAVVSPHSKIQIKTELLSPHSTTRTPTPQRPLRPVNKAGEPGKVRRQLAMNLNKGGPVINNRRNARERGRVKQVNQGFAVLRAHLPAAEKSKKISKVDTLRGAIDYIQGLSELLGAAAAVPMQYEPPPAYGYRTETALYGPSAAARQPLLNSPPSPLDHPGYLPDQPLLDHPGYLPDPPPYRETLRELRQHQHHQQQLLQLGGAGVGGGSGVGRADEVELLGALRWWPASSPHSLPPL